MNFWEIFQLIIIIFAIVYLAYQAFLFIERKMSAKLITSEELVKLGRTIQLIDIRERDDFNVKHILGSRNVPMSQFKQNMATIRKDQPVYLYDEFGLLTGRAASKLKRNGYKDIFILKGGLDRFEGKVKVRDNDKK